MAAVFGAAEEPGRKARSCALAPVQPLRLLSHAFEPGRTLRVERRGGEIAVEAGGRCLVFRIAPCGRPDETSLAPATPLRAGEGHAVFAALEMLFGADPDLASVRLAGPDWAALLPDLLARGLAVEDVAGGPVALAGMVWQIRSGWMAGGDAPFPLDHSMGTGGRHPRRRPLADGTRYARYIPWLGGVLRFDTATREDLPCLHRWMNDPRVDRFWREAGDLERHRAYLDAQRQDAHTWPLVARFEGEAFGYFEIYWARESLVGPFYDAGDHDRGWHVLIGEDAFRGRRWASAWLPSLMHMIFLDDARTLSIVGEPAADHAAQLRNLARSGFERIGTIDLPMKRAALVSLSRRRFFEDRLWHPAPVTDADEA